MSITPLPEMAFPKTELSGNGLQSLYFYRVISSFQSAILSMLFLLSSTPFLLAGHTDERLRNEESSLANPIITVRLANPQYDCLTNRYCVDVEFQSDLEDQELFGMNIRFFYLDNQLELIDFSDFQGGYSWVGNSVQTSGPTFGFLYFGLGLPGNSAADWVNAQIEKTDISSPPIYISTTDWTKLFQICFTIDEVDFDSTNFCPPIVWDLEMDPANGGYLTGDDGVVITVFSDEPGVETEPALEQVIQFNWEYTGDGSMPPYGQPTETNCFAFADAEIDGSTAQGCYFTNRVYQPMQEELPNVMYEWNFGEGAVPPTAYGYGPHTVYYDTMGMKTVSLILSPTEPGAQCADTSSISFMIVNCPGNITGTVKSVANVGISGVNLRLFTDADTNGVADNENSVRSVFTNSGGTYSMASIKPGHYVIVQVQPSGWLTVDDGDLTEDGDAVENNDPLDNLIPVSIFPSELDATNYFTEGPTTGTITGSAFTDFDNDQFPDPGEGISDIAIQLFDDVNTDGIADSNVPLASQVTTSNGSYIFSNVAIGHYVVCEVQPSGYLNVKDYDSTNDNDVVTNSNIYNDTIPVTITNGETDANNYFIDIDSCSLMVTNTNSSGSGSFKHAIECASSGDTVLFHPSLSGLTISIFDDRVLIDKSIVIYSTHEPRVTIASLINGLFDIEANYVVEFVGLNVISGLSGNTGAAFNNDGILKLNNINVLRNPLLPQGEYLIYNSSVSQLFLSGSCFLEMN